jgi:hypothetical protein
MISSVTAFTLKPKAKSKHQSIKRSQVIKFFQHSNHNSHTLMYVLFVCMYCLTIHDMFLSILKFMAKGKHSTSLTFSTQWFHHHLHGL